MPHWAKMEKYLLYGIYLVADFGLLPSMQDLARVARAAAQNGACAVQLRAKQATGCQLVELGQALKVALSSTGVPLIINDRVDVALACQAEGVHLGQSDMPYEAARRLLGPEAIIGLSIEHLTELAPAMLLEGLDYVAASPVFATLTKTDTAPALGLAGLHKLSTQSRVPVVAIGGINLGNLASVKEAGAASAAVVSAICSAQNSGVATRQLVAAWNAA